MGRITLIIPVYICLWSGRTFIDKSRSHYLCFQILHTILTQNISGSFAHVHSETIITAVQINKEKEREREREAVCV